jgi:hypothetical protein
MSGICHICQQPLPWELWKLFVEHVTCTRPAPEPTREQRDWQRKKLLNRTEKELRKLEEHRGDWRTLERAKKFLVQSVRMKVQYR